MKEIYLSSGGTAGHVTGTREREYDWIADGEEILGEFGSEGSFRIIDILARLHIFRAKKITVGINF